MAPRRGRGKGRSRRRRAKARRGTHPFRRALIYLTVLGLVVGAAYVAWLDHRIRMQFEGKRWSLPARLYARPLELYAGMPMGVEQLRTELALLGYRAVKDPSRPGSYARRSGAWVIHARAFRYWDGEEPGRRLRLVIRHDKLEDLKAASGEPIPLARIEPLLIGRIYPRHNEDRVLVRLAEVPPLLVKGLIAVEDRRFHAHHGVSARAVARALWENLRAGKTVQGGSTITQQLAKNLFLTPRRTLTRKLNEAAMALLLEWHYDKDEILEAYLNEVYLGQEGRHAVHGFGLAAHHYFARDLGELRLPEVALLIGLVRGASYYNPRRHPKRARARRALVLEQMLAQGLISERQARRARRAPLGVTAHPPAASRYPAFLDLARRQLRRDYREEDLRGEGLRIFTTLDPWAQSVAERAVRGLARLERRHSLARGRLQSAVVVTDRESGEVLAVVGGRDPRAAGFNRALDALRPVGSLIKPAVYLTALGPDGGYTVETRLADGPVRLKGHDGEIWAPKNYDRKTHGQVALHSALARSYNLATVHLGLDLGLRKVRRTLRELGVARDLPSYPSLVLGAVELPPVEVAQMYQTLAAGGFRVPLRAIREVTGADHRPLARYRLSITEAVDPRAAYLVNVLLREAYREGTGRGEYRRLPGRPELAGKTGTTDELRDSWFAGFGRQRLAVVWVGRDDNRPAGLTGASGALPIWGQVMQGLAARAWWAPTPEGVHWYWVDDAAGERTDEGCPGARRMPFIDGTVPPYRPCPEATAAGAP